MEEEKKAEVAEQPAAPHTTVKTDKKFPLGGIIAIAAVVAVVTGVVGFASGVQFQKVASNNRAANQQTRGDVPGGFGARGRMGMNGTFGEITAISDSSITVAMRQRFNSSSNSSTATTRTYAINSSTKITVEGETGKVSNIKTGDQVVIAPDTADAKVASTIRVGAGGPRE